MPIVSVCFAELAPHVLRLIFYHLLFLKLKETFVRVYNRFGLFFRLLAHLVYLLRNDLVDVRLLDITRRCVAERFLLQILKLLLAHEVDFCDVFLLSN